jgi:hypothetical protein
MQMFSQHWSIIMSRWDIKSWDDIRPSKKEDFDWSPGWNLPVMGKWENRWTKFKAWLKNIGRTVSYYLKG